MYIPKLGGQKEVPKPKNKQDWHNPKQVAKPPMDFT
jgi:hypothetical protein